MLLFPNALRLFKYVFDQCVNKLIFQPANEIQIKPIVKSNNAQAITINVTPRVNVRSLTGCLSMLLLNIFLIIVNDLL